MDDTANISRVALSDKWLSSQGYHRSGGNSIEPILSFIVMDQFYMTFARRPKAVKFYHRDKLTKKAIMREYHLLTSEFFRAYNAEETDAVMEVFDEFEAYLANDLMVVKVQIMNLLPDLDFEAQKTAADFVVSNVLCQCASVIWGHCYKTGHGNEAKNPHIDSLERLTARLADAYLATVCDKRVNPNKSQMLSDALDVLCRKIIRFLNKPENQR